MTTSITRNTNVSQATNPPASRKDQLADSGKMTQYNDEISEVLPSAIGAAIAQLPSPTTAAVSTGALMGDESGAMSPEEFFDIAHHLIDPDDLIGKWRRGDIAAEMLVGEQGQNMMMLIRDRLTRMQALIDALRGIMDAYNDSLKKAAEQIGR